ncbi:MAG: integrase [Candidatus Binatota bacterium]|nr:integrase [Candidatus Binatota bacterium]
MACVVKTNHSGYLALQLFWRGLRSWQGTGDRDTPKNRGLLEARARIISEEMERGTFDYRKHFPDGNMAELFRPPAPVIVRPITIGEYFKKVWIPRKRPPVIRKGLERDYRDDFKRYILPKFENTTWAELTAPMLDAFRTYLLDERKLALKSCKNIIDGSFRACYRDAREFDSLPEIQGPHQFEKLAWPRMRSGKPNPFSEEERDKIPDYFKRKIPHYYPFALCQFLTGLRPSEALALRWGDIDLNHRNISISKSRNKDDEGATKTAASEREIKVRAELAKELARIKPLHVTEDTHVFVNEDGEPLNFHTWRGKVSGRAIKSGEKTPHGVWYRALRATGMKPRGPYTMRHTFISIGLTNGANVKLIAEYSGTSLEMIQKHYGKFVGNVDEQLALALGSKSETFSETFDEHSENAEGQIDENARRGAALAEKESWWAHLDSNQGPTGYEPVALTN